MTKLLAFIFLSAVFFFFAPTHARHAKDTLKFQVQGKVYCDTCRVQFETKISEPISGAHIRLECKSTKTENVTYSVEGNTDKNGLYTVPVEGDHELDICTVAVDGSPRDDCNEPIDEKTQVVCTNMSGMHYEIRYANSLGYMKKEADSRCKKVLDQIGFVPGAQP